jgi:hypothetical protein
LVRAKDIKDAESLQAWLESLPQETEDQRETARRCAVTIAHRAAMRSLPYFWQATWKNVSPLRLEPPGPNDRSIALGQTIRCMLVSCVNTDAAFARTAISETKATEYPQLPIVGAALASVAADIRIAAVYAKVAASLPLRFLMPSKTLNESDVHSAQAATDFYTLFFNAASEDALALEQDVSVGKSLWPADATVLQDQFFPFWLRFKNDLLSDNEGWRFWVEMYENALHGRPQDYDLLTKIALIDSADWDKGADHVNALIAQIRLEHIAETRPLGEDAIDIGPDGLWHRTGKSDIDGDILQDAVESVQDEIADLRTKLQGPQGNMFTALVSDLDLLEQRIARHPDKPLRLHDVFIRVQGHIARNLQSGELPDDDCVRDLSSVLGNAALDMCNACDKTKSVVQKRMAVRFDEADEKTRDDLKTIAEGAARISDADLASEFIEDAEVIADEAIPLSEKTSTLYRLQTRLARIVFHDGGNLVKALVLLGGIGGGVATVSWVTMTILRFLFA